VHDQRQGAGQQRRRAQALHRAGGDQDGRLGAAAQAADPAGPIRNTRLAPRRAAIDPAVSMTEARASV
jgi:hypothetical protein